MITQDQLKNILDYDQYTGVFTRKTITCNRVKLGDIAGCIHSSGYVNIKVFGKIYKAHRLAWLYVHGCFPKNGIDHINRIKNDNRIANLREADQRQNGWNNSINKNNSSGCKGVYKKDKKWVSSITDEYGNPIWLGTFSKMEDARRVYLENAKSFRGEFANLS